MSDIYMQDMPAGDDTMSAPAGDNDTEKEEMDEEKGDGDGDEA